MKNLTEMEIAKIKDIIDSEYRNGYLSDNDPVWTFSVVENNTDKGVLGSLVKKGIVNVYDWDDETVVEFTEMGLELAIKINS